MSPPEIGTAGGSGASASGLEPGVVPHDGIRLGHLVLPERLRQTPQEHVAIAEVQTRADARRLVVDAAPKLLDRQIATALLDVAARAIEVHLGTLSIGQLRRNRSSRHGDGERDGGRLPLSKRKGRKRLLRWEAEARGERVAQGDDFDRTLGSPERPGIDRHAN